MKKHFGLKGSTHRFWTRCSDRWAAGAARGAAQVVLNHPRETMEFHFGKSNRKCMSLNHQIFWAMGGLVSRSAARRGFTIEVPRFHEFEISLRGVGRCGAGGRRRSCRKRRETKGNGPGGGSVGPAARRGFTINVMSFHRFRDHVGPR